MRRIGFDTTCATVRAAMEIAATPERVFAALTDPAELAEWWGALDQYRGCEWRVDARSGGRWSVRALGPDGVERTVHGEFRVVDPPRRLEYTWHPSWEDGPPSRVRFDLEPATVDGVPGTRVSVTHTRIGAGSATACATAGARPGLDGSSTVTRIVWMQPASLAAAPAWARRERVELDEWSAPVTVCGGAR